MSLLEAVAGLSESDARRRLVASATTPIGLIKHAAAAERFWFQRLLLGLEESDCDGPASPGDARFAVTDEETLDDVITEFRAASQRSRDIVATRDLGDVTIHPRAGAVSVRWVLLHMIEEVGRHAGHADILR